MMSGFPTTDVIATAWRKSGAGICVLVEGETERDDAWYYSFWFGNRVREVTFFPQDGWEQVAVGVQTLRRSLGEKRVYGIIDRDFESPPTYPPVPANGILRTRKFATENYLLSPDCWFQCIEPYLLRSTRPEWASRDQVSAKIDALYHECLPITGYNWTLREARRIDFNAFRRLAESDRKDRVHPDQLLSRNPAADLNGIAATMAIVDDLGAIYQERLAYLQTCDPATLEELVNGKFVMKRLRQSFPLQPLQAKTWDDMLSSYVFRCPHPPSDLAALVDAIVADAHTA